MKTVSKKAILTEVSSGKHNLWHHLAMVVYSEIVNFVWLAVGVVMALGGLAIFKFASGAFFRLALGLPIIIIGASVIFFKLHELILVIARPKRLKAMCIFCQLPFKLLKRRKDAILR